MESSVLAFLEGPGLAIVLVIVLVVFGGAQLPKLARSLGQAQRELQRGLREGVDERPQVSDDRPARDETAAGTQVAGDGTTVRRTPDPRRPTDEA